MTFYFPWKLVLFNFGFKLLPVDGKGDQFGPEDQFRHVMDLEDMGGFFGFFYEAGEVGVVFELLYSGVGGILDWSLHNFEEYQAEDGFSLGL